MKVTLDFKTVLLLMPVVLIIFIGLASTAVAQETEMESSEATSEQEVITLEGVVVVGTRAKPRSVSFFVDAYTAQFGIAPDGPAALGYDSTTIVIEAMRRTTDITPTAIRDQIEATQNYSGATILSHFDENRHAVKSLVINTVKDGEIQFH